MILSIFSGNLVADATYRKLDEEKSPTKSPISFTVAVNIDTQRVIYRSCTFWIKTKENPEILNFLKKGFKVLIKSSYVVSNEYTTVGEEKPRYFENYTVDELEFMGKKEEKEEKTIPIPAKEKTTKEKKTK